VEFKANDKVDVIVAAVPERNFEGNTYKNAKVIGVHHQKDKRGNYIRGVDPVIYRVQVSGDVEFWARKDQMTKAATAAANTGA
jgi:hypothetical protein